MRENREAGHGTFRNLSYKEAGPGARKQHHRCVGTAFGQALDYGPHAVGSQVQMACGLGVLGRAFDLLLDGGVKEIAGEIAGIVKIRLRDLPPDGLAYVLGQERSVLGDRSGFA